MAGKSVFGVAQAKVQWAHYGAYVWGKIASLTLNNNMSLMGSEVHKIVLLCQSAPWFAMYPM